MCPKSKESEMNPANDVIRLLQAGDKEALRMIYEMSGDRVFRTAYGILGSRQDAEDATQEIFLRLYRKARSFRFRSSFSSWFYRLSVNYCLNLLRRRRLLSWLPLPEVVDSGAREIEKAEARDEAQALLSRLEPRARSLLVLREMQGLSYEEISEVMSLPLGTVRSSLSRARKELTAIGRRSSKKRGANHGL